MLTAAQLAALEKAQGEQAAQGEVARDWPGSCGTQDPFLVGPLKGGGRISQQPVVDPYSKGAFATLSERTPSLPAAELRHAQGGPVVAEPAVPLRRLLTDRGTAYGGSPDSPEEEWY
jgi:hypothetical protein